MTEITEAPNLKSAVEGLRSLSRDGEAFVICDSIFFDEIGTFHPHQDIFCIPGGEVSKGIGKAEEVWRWLTEKRASRRSLLVSIGGGSITDLSGFVASCFKRGMDVAYVPTTVLASVDAAIGGKTGINFCGLKNEIGTFHMPKAVVMVPRLLDTLDYSQLASGYGEVLKTALLRGKEATVEALNVGYELSETHRNPFTAKIMRESGAFKQHIVGIDPYEKDERRQLNLGHTFAHGLESYARKRGEVLSHGHAVAIGLVAMSVLSHIELNLDTSLINNLAGVVKAVFKPYEWLCGDFSELWEYMLHDKKNTVRGKVDFVLLQEVGKPVCGFHAAHDNVRDALEITKDYLGM